MSGRLKSKWKRILAGALAMMLVISLCNHEGSIQTYAQRETLPGVEKVVVDILESGESYLMLEVIPSKEAATLGYLVKGQETVSDGNVLADLPSAEERQVGINAFEEEYASGALNGIVGAGDGYPVSYTPYREGSGSNLLAINGGFVQDEAGPYNLIFQDAVYRKVQLGEIIEQTRYDKKYQFEDADGTGVLGMDERVFVTFNKIVGDESNPRTSYVADGVTDVAYASGRYAMRSNVEMSDISRDEFLADDYVGRDVYIRTNDQYAYYGKIVRYTDVPEEYLLAPTPTPMPTQDPSVSSGDSTVSGNDALLLAEEEVRDPSSDLYVLSYLHSTAVCWAQYYPDGSYIFDYIAGGHIVEFESEVFNGDYYVSAAYKNTNGNKLISHYFEENSGGEYVMEAAAMQDVVYATREEFDETLDRYRFIRNYSGGNQFADTVAYSGGFSNNEWFEKYVFDLLPAGGVSDTATALLEREAFDVQVKSVTVDELVDVAYGNANLGFSISDVDFIYLAGGEYAAYDTTAQGGLDYAATMLGAYAVNNQIPVVMEHSFIQSNADKRNYPLVQMAFLMLLNQSADMSSEAEKLGYVQGGRFYFLSDIPAENWQSYELSVNELFGNYKEALSGHVYVHDDTDNGYVHADFLTDWNGGTARISAEEKLNIYTKVLDEIDSENFLRELNSEPLLERVLSKATITRYIINYRNQRVKVKEVINVLDVEPCYASLADGTSEWLTEEKILSFLPDGTYEGKIYTTKMSSSEFIGRVEDLNENYDMIYLGDSVIRLNTSANGETVFNDSMMNGLVYYNIGDIYTYSGEGTENTYRLWNTTISDASDTYRGTGNDINGTRQEELTQYISAGYAFVLADSLIAYDTAGRPMVNKARVDCNSRFYKVLEFALSYQTDTSGQRQYLYWGKNVYTESMLINNFDNQEMFVQYLNLSKLKITFEEGLGQNKPTSYIDNYDGFVTSNSFLNRRNGRYELEYIFSLNNYSAVSQIHTTYDCKLYVDSNADGRYAGSDYSLNASSDANTEELVNLDIYVYRNRAWEPVSMIYDAATGGYRYQLMTGNIYRVVRALPEDYQGLVPWKLVFYDNSNPLVRCSEIGYSAVKSSSVETINVLQLMSNRADVWKLDSDSDMTRMLAQVEEATGFDVNLNCVLASDFFWNTNNRFSFRAQRVGESTKDYYYGRIYDWIMDDSNCNMIILGFDDNYRFGNSGDQTMNMAAGEAIRDYIEAGKSILFTHDSSSYVNYDSSYYTEGGYSWYWGYEFNKTIRAAVGLDRYGALRYDYPEGSEYREILDSYQYDVAYQPGLEISRASLMTYLREKYNDYAALKSSYASALRGMQNWDGAYKRVDKYNDLAQTMVEKYGAKIRNLENGSGVNASYAMVEQMDGLTDPAIVRKLDADLSSFSSRNYGANNTYFYNKNSMVRQALYTRDTSQYWYGQYKAWDNGRLMATQVNQGQITSFPYVITNLEDNVVENDYLEVAQTHYQWLQPNMELDRDGDGKNDIVVWYCLSDLSSNGKEQARSNGSTNSTYNIYNLTPNDVVNNYYIYNMGNVTYSGVGHSTPDSINEKKLFINTMVAAYSAGTKAPNLELTQDGSRALNTIYLTYDRANKLFIAGAEEIGASVKVSDYNLLSDSQIRLELYVKDENGDVVNGIDEKVSKLSTDEVIVRNTLIADDVAGRMSRTESDEGDSEGIAAYFAGGYYVLTPNVEYDISIKTTALGFYNEGDVNGNIEFQDDQSLSNKVYLRATTVYNEGMLRTPSSHKEILVGVSELFELK